MSPHLFTVLFIMDQLLLAPSFLASPHFPMLTQHRVAYHNHDTRMATTSFYSSNELVTPQRKRRFSWFSRKRRHNNNGKDVTGIRPWTPIVPQQQDGNELLTTTTNVAVKTGRKRKRRGRAAADGSLAPAKKNGTSQQEQEQPTVPTRAITPLDPSVDLTGRWKLYITDAFKKEYDTYLRNLGQPALVRSIAVSVISRTTEETRQDGDKLWIQSTNPRGVWERTLIAAPDATLTMQTIDKETVQAQAWWEGNVHRSWLLGVTKYGGGSFESKRYLQDGLLCCESTFHPTDTKRPKANITWRFARIE